MRLLFNIVLINSDADELTEMLRELQAASLWIDLEMNFQKTKIISSNNIIATLDGQIIEAAEENIYLEHKINIKN